MHAVLLVLATVHRHSFHALHEQVLVDEVHVILILCKDEGGRCGLLQAGQQVLHLGLFLDILHLLREK